MSSKSETKAAEQNMSDNSEKTIVTPEILNLDYRYVKLLGEGANGFTWLAKDRRNALDVAIKELKFVDDFKSLELFQREAEVLQSVDVIGVPKCYKSITNGFTSYIVQEYIPYPSLDSMLEEMRKTNDVFEEEEVFFIIDKVSEILFALQTQYIPAIIHRDIKPGNILYRRSDRSNEGRVWLIDFGAVDNAHKQSSGSTIAGTFGYMAPEQLQGEVSPRSDFYALGATALHLLTGVFPYEIPNELFQLKFHPVIEEKAPDTSKPMVDLLDKLLASNAQERPQDVHELRRLIHEAMAAAEKYRKAMAGDWHSEYPDWEPRTFVGRWFRKTKFGAKMHQKNLARKRRRWRKKQEKRRERLMRRLEKEELKAKKMREEEEKRMALEREQCGVVCTCEARRVTVSQYSVSSYKRDEILDRFYDISIPRYHTYEDKFEFTSLLEGIFCYEGNWYPAYLMANDIRITVRCTTEAPPNTKINEDTFEVLFVPSKTDISLKRQTVWLSPSLYTKFTGQVAPPPPLPAACAQHS